MLTTDRPLSKKCFEKLSEVIPGGVNSPVRAFNDLDMVPIVAIQFQALDTARGEKMQATRNFSDYLIFVDESGDHGLTTINPENPVFVLAFCIFKKSDYITVVKEKITKLKLDFWGHDLAILHNHEIRKSKGEFSFLFNEEVRAVFLQALNDTIEAIPFSIIATAIDKRNLKKNYSNPDNPYLIALGFCLEHAYMFLKEKDQLKHLTHIVVEGRGKVEDKDLELAFRRISDQASLQGELYPFDIKFANKNTNSCGLQIADLVAHPIARHVIQPEQQSMAFTIVKKKLLGYPRHEGVGLKCFP